MTDPLHNTLNLQFKQYIGGAWVDAANSGTWDVVDPGTEQVLVTVPFGDATDVRVALEAAQQAQPKWAAKTVYERAAIVRKAGQWLRDHADELGRIMTSESGKPLAESRREWQICADMCDYYAEDAIRVSGEIVQSRVSNKRVFVIRQPLGVVASITAWNFPAWLLARVWAPAIAVGCAVVGRPSEYTPLSAMCFAGAFEAAGLPAGVLNVINGDPGEMANELLTNRICRKISFTGSTRVGRLLMQGAATNITRLSLELGGNAPAVVFPDADLESAARGLVASKYRNNGQVCVSPQRFYIHQQVYEEFLSHAVRLTEGLQVGHGLDHGVNVGPLINAKQRDRVEALVTDARSHGAQVETGGGRLDRPGFFYQPTILTGITDQMKIADEEVFGPVLLAAPFTDADEAIRLANATDFGLAAYIYTRDLSTAIRMAEGIEAGVIGVNDPIPTATEAPFGGFKQSGLGREQGHEAVRNFLETKMVSVAL